MVHSYLSKHHANDLKVIEDLEHEIEVVDAAAATAKQSVGFVSELPDVLQDMAA